MLQVRGGFVLMGIYGGRGGQYSWGIFSAWRSHIEQKVYCIWQQSTPFSSFLYPLPPGPPSNFLCFWAMKMVKVPKLFSPKQHTFWLDQNLPKTTIIFLVDFFKNKKKTILLPIFFFANFKKSFIFWGKSQDFVTSY